ncbi:hypothetical protein Taro_005971 [Colocasia esculenta]|uniref:Uncharacterized protein n=1 Tax=Colocasia esculenta TaxID=4460 RepID=A0A843TR88_COLES|nr:hypothetical protein [Colocasia esculenta]
MATTAPQTDPTIFSRLERLDVMMGFMEEIIRGNGRAKRSSCASTTSSGSDGGGGGGGGCDSSVGSSPKSLEGRCRPLVEVMREAQLKGPLIDRLHHLEDRVVKVSFSVLLASQPMKSESCEQLSLQFEEEMESERKKEQEERSPREEKHHHHRKGIKSLTQGTHDILGCGSFALDKSNRAMAVPPRLVIRVTE